jgi:hypothetical protein
MTDANTATTLCWHCSEPYPIGDESCPACNATNGNVNPEQAQAEAKGAGNVDHEWKFQDDSFDHAFGTEPVHYFACAHCEATRPVEAGDFDDNWPED